MKVMAAGSALIVHLTLILSKMEIFVFPVLKEEGLLFILGH